MNIWNYSFRGSFHATVDPDKKLEFLEELCHLLNAELPDRERALKVMQLVATSKVWRGPHAEFFEMQRVILQKVRAFGHHACFDYRRMVRMCGVRLCIHCQRFCPPEQVVCRVHKQAMLALYRIFPMCLARHIMAFVPVQTFAFYQKQFTVFDTVKTVHFPAQKFKNPTRRWSRADRSVNWRVRK